SRLAEERLIDVRPDHPVFRDRARGEVEVRLQVPVGVRQSGFSECLLYADDVQGLLVRAQALSAEILDLREDPRVVSRASPNLRLEPVIACGDAGPGGDPSHSLEAAVADDHLV